MFATLGCPNFLCLPIAHKGREGQGCGVQSCRKGHLARETFSTPVEPHVATLVTSYHRLNPMSAKALVRRRVDGWTSRLSPPEHEFAISPARPLDTNLTFRRG